MEKRLSRNECNDENRDSLHPTGCALAAPPPINGCHIVPETGAEKRTISLDAKRRPLQARVGREH